MSCDSILSVEDILTRREEFLGLAVRDFASIDIDRPMILLQCSSVKPWYNSPSFRRFRKTLREYNLDIEGFNVVFASDAFGMVHYDHVDKYPYNCYDIGPDVLARNRGLQGLVRMIVCNQVRHIPEGQIIYVCVARVWWDLVSDCFSIFKIRKVPYGHYGAGCRELARIIAVERGRKFF